MRTLILGSVSCLLLTSCVGDQQSWQNQASQVLGTLASSPITQSALSNSDIVAGLREALKVGTGNVVGQLGVLNGFNLDPKVHIPLPSTLQRVDDALSLIGMSALTDDLETRINRAAEIATPKAKQLFFNSIRQMTISDAQQIFNGPNDAATQFFRRTMGQQLGQEISPLVNNALASAGAVQAYDRALGQYGQLPFVSDVKTNLNSYVVDRTLDGIFYYVAQEEAAIRANPAARTTEILKKVFGSR